MGIQRVDIDGGGWADLKEKLKIGDKANIESYASDGITADRTIFKFNSNRHRIATAAVRIVNLMLLNGDDKPIEFPVGKPFDERVRVLSLLDEDVFERLYDAVDKFEDSLSKEKNGPTAIANDSSPVSQSPGI